MILYPLPDTILDIQNNAEKFLSGLTSNSLDQPFNAFLTVHGRIIATFRQKRVTEGDYMLIVPNLAVDALLQHLDRYAKISGAKIIRNPKQPFLDLYTEEVHVGSPDPLGKTESTVSDVQFNQYRLNKKLPLMGVDYQAEEFLLNVDDGERYVSFTKCCFLGQEPVAKVHNRSKPSKKLVVKFEDECSEEEKLNMTSKTLDPKTGRVRGFVFVKN